MSESNYMGLVRSLETLKINLLLEEFAAFAMENGFSEKDISAIERTFSFLAQRREQMTIDMMLRLSRLPRRNPKTFDNFRFDDVRGKDVDRLRSLPSLSALGRRIWPWPSATNAADRSSRPTSSRCQSSTTCSLRPGGSAMKER